GCGQQAEPGRQDTTKHCLHGVPDYIRPAADPHLYGHVTAGLVGSRAPVDSDRRETAHALHRSPRRSRAATTAAPDRPNLGRLRLPAAATEEPSAATARAAEDRHARAIAALRSDAGIPGVPASTRTARTGGNVAPRLPSETGAASGA